MKPLDQLLELTPSDDKAQVFRTEASEGKLGDTRQPKRNAVLLHKPQEWTLLTPDEARDRVVVGNTMLVLGQAGMGKSHFCLELCDILKHKKAVVKLSKTHVAADRIKGITADQYVRAQKDTPRNLCIFIDEISQLDVGLWGSIANFTSLTEPHIFFY